MPLGSVLNTALTGINAASTALQATSYNLANARTPGFRAARVEFLTQPPSTSRSGGSITQIGAGVRAVITEESSGTDVGRSLVDLVASRTLFRANAATFGTASDLLDELAFLSPPAALVDSIRL